MTPVKALLTALTLIVAGCTPRAEKASPVAAEPEQATLPAAPAAPPSAPAPRPGLTEVTDPSQVCMVNNQYMGRPQIPTTVEGKTYYGCCPMCKGRLEKEAAVQLVPRDRALSVADPGDQLAR